MKNPEKYPTCCVMSFFSLKDCVKQNDKKLENVFILVLFFLLYEKGCLVLNLLN